MNGNNENIKSENYRSEEFLNRKRERNRKFKQMKYFDI